MREYRKETSKARKVAGTREFSVTDCNKDYILKSTNNDDDDDEWRLFTTVHHRHQEYNVFIV